MRKTLLFLAVAASAACLAAAYLKGGLSWESAFGVLPGVLPVLGVRRAHRTWAPVLGHVFLWGMFLIAAVGILQGASAILALPGAGFALAAWDLMNLDRAMAGSTPTRSTVRFQKRHAWALALSVAVGLLLGEAGLALAFRVPFPVMCLLVLLDIVCLTQVFLLMRKDGSAR